MTGPRPRVTVLIPARDEARWIGDCIASVVEQDYPHDQMEVIVVVDAASTDRTDAQAKAAMDAADFGAWDIVRNVDGGGTPANLNAGLAVATGEIVCRVDARSRIPADYVRRCVEILRTRPEVAVVGGAQVAVATADDPRSTGIARALNNRWGMGLSRYRRGATSGAADTVYLGAFRTADLRDAGGWNPAFATNQDFELNRRMATWGQVWFESGLPVGYVPRADLRSLHQQYRRFGAWKVRYWTATGDRPRPRQVALLVGVPLATVAGLGAVEATSGARRAAVAATILGGAAFVEIRGSRGPRGALPVHGWSAAALGAVALGWLRGAWGQILRPHRDG
jgi:glycosyltransferase involved in cell wall biosynthesis